MSKVAALYVRRDSIYKTMKDVDCWDIDRDARLWPGGCPVVAHPPCRSWGGLSHFAKPRPDERALAPHALALVRRWGGVLEHPRSSKLWPEYRLPLGPEVDAWGGFTLAIMQSWWGYPTPKPTLLYVCGLPRKAVPAPSLSLSLPPKVVDSSRRQNGEMNGRYLPKSQREVTPPAMAVWLVDLARRCSPPSFALMQAAEETA